MSTTPTYVAAGTYTTGVGALSVPMPAGIQAGDLLVLFAESENQDIATPTTGGTWTQIGVAQGTGTAGNATSARLEVWARLATASETNVTVADSGDHTSAIIHAYRGVEPTSFFTGTATGGVVAAATTAVSMAGITTGHDNALVVYALAGSADTATAQFPGSPTNASLTSLTKRTDNATTDGDGGSITVITGIKATAGATGTTTGTLSTSTVQAFMVFALRAQVNFTVVGAPGAYTYTGSSVKGLRNYTYVDEMLETFEATPNTATSPSGLITSWTKSGTATLGRTTLNAVEGTYAWNLSATGVNVTSIETNLFNGSSFDSFSIDGAISGSVTVFFLVDDNGGNSVSAFINTGTMTTVTLTRAAILASKPSFNFASMKIRISMTQTSGTNFVYFDKLRATPIPPASVAATSGTYTYTGKNVGLLADIGGFIKIEDFEDLPASGGKMLWNSNSIIGTLTRETTNKTEGTYDWKLDTNMTGVGGGSPVFTTKESLENWTGAVPTSSIPWVSGRSIAATLGYSVPGGATVAQSTDSVTCPTLPTDGTYFAKFTNPAPSGNQAFGLSMADFDTVDGTNWTASNYTGTIDLSGTDYLYFDFDVGNITSSDGNLYVIALDSATNSLINVTAYDYTGGGNKAFDLTANPSVDRSAAVIGFFLLTTGAVGSSISIGIDNIGWDFTPTMDLLRGTFYGNGNIKTKVGVDINVTTLPASGEVTFLIRDMSDTYVGHTSTTTTGAKTLVVDVSGGSLSSGFKAEIFPAHYNTGTSSAEDAGLGQYVYYLDYMRMGNTFTAAFNVGGDTGTYTYTGQSAGLTSTRKVVADVGAYTYSGVAAAFQTARTMVAATGAYTLSGQNVGTISTRILTAGTGSYTYTGVDVGLNPGRVLNALAGSYVYTGQDAGLYQPARGTVNVTQDNNTTVSAGTVKIQGSVTITQADHTVSATGTAQNPSISGTANITQADQTLSSAGTVKVVGSAAITQAGDTTTSAAVLLVKGSLITSQAGDSVSSAGVVKVKGAFTYNQAGDTVSSTGTVTVKGSVNATQASDTTVSAAVVKIMGSVSLSQADNTASSTATILVKGVSNTSQQNQTVSATGTVTIKAAVSITQDNQTSSSAGKVLVQGASTLTQADNTVAAAGGVKVQGSLTATQNDNQLNAAASVVASGTSITVQQDQTVVSTGQVMVKGSVNITQNDQTLSAAAYNPVQGFSFNFQPGNTLSSAGKVVIKADVALNQNDNTLESEGNVFSYSTFYWGEELIQFISYGDTPIYRIYLGNKRVF